MHILRGRAFQKVINICLFWRANCNYLNQVIPNSFLLKSTNMKKLFIAWSVVISLVAFGTSHSIKKDTRGTVRYHDDTIPKRKPLPDTSVPKPDSPPKQRIIIQ